MGTCAADTLHRGVARSRAGVAKTPRCGLGDVGGCGRVRPRLWPHLRRAIGRAHRRDSSGGRGCPADRRRSRGHPALALAGLGVREHLMTGIGYGRQRQADIYLAGVRGERPRVPQSAEGLEQQAERAMSKEGFAYIAGGAGLETTMKANRAAFERVRIVPRMLRWRWRDLDLGYLPFLAGKGIAQYVTDPVFQRLVDDASPPERGAVTPGAVRALWRVARAYPGSTWANLRSPRPRQAVRTFLDVFARPSLNWHDLALVRDATKLPILLKGILHPDDARRALDEGVDGIVVSNHGGRQVDG